MLLQLQQLWTGVGIIKTESPHANVQFQNDRKAETLLVSQKRALPIILNNRR